MYNAFFIYPFTLPLKFNAGIFKRIFNKFPDSMALTGSDLVEPVIDAASAFADALQEADQRLSPEAVAALMAQKGNGDGFYGSDAASLTVFDRTLGDLTIEARIKLSQTLRPAWFGFGSITSGDPDFDPTETVYYGFRFQGTLYGEKVSFTYLDSEGTPASSSIPWTIYDEWHVFRVVVKVEEDPDGTVNFTPP